MEVKVCLSLLIYLLSSLPSMFWSGKCILYIYCTNSLSTEIWLYKIYTHQALMTLLLWILPFVLGLLIQEFESFSRFAWPLYANFHKYFNLRSTLQHKGHMKSPYYISTLKLAWIALTAPRLWYGNVTLVKNICSL